VGEPVHQDAVTKPTHSRSKSLRAKRAREIQQNPAEDGTDVAPQVPKIRAGTVPISVGTSRRIFLEAVAPSFKGELDV
jgi:hypothetical protein